MYGTKCDVHYLECGKNFVKEHSQKDRFLISAQKHFNNEKSEQAFKPYQNACTN